MDGIGTISQRIAGIQAQLTALSPASRVTATATPTSAATPAPATSFDQVLGAAATEFAPPAAPAPAAVLNADGVPADLAAYGNGKVPPDALAPIGTTGHRLWAPAATKFDQLLAAASADGVKIGINDSYRTYERQVELVPRLGLYNQGGLAAVPGTSRHGWGMAVDLKLDGEAQAWMRANGERFGFVEDTPREPWHWAFYPDRIKQ